MMDELWEVVGGAGSGGILVRQGKELTSSPAPERLATGSKIKQLALLGERLHYELLDGSGPHDGWVSLKLKDKPLVEKWTDGQKSVPDQSIESSAEPLNSSNGSITGSTDKLTPDSLLDLFERGEIGDLVEEYQKLFSELTLFPSAYADGEVRQSGAPSPLTSYVPVSQGDSRPRLLVMGDSILHGPPFCPSAPCVAAVAKRNEQKIFIDNSAWGGILSFQLLAPQDFKTSHGPLPLPSLKEFRCQYACIMVGTNDAMSICAPVTWTDTFRTERSMENDVASVGTPKLPNDWETKCPPSTRLYEESLREIVRQLSAAGAKVAVVTPPLLGEDLQDKIPERRMRASPFAVGREMAEATRRVASEESCQVLPLFECMVAHIRILQQDGRAPVAWSPARFGKLGTALFREIMAGKKGPLGELLPEQDRLALTLDLCHLNEAGGAILCSLVQLWLDSQLGSSPA